MHSDDNCGLGGGILPEERRGDEATGAEEGATGSTSQGEHFYVISFFDIMRHNR